MVSAGGPSKEEIIHAVEASGHKLTASAAKYTGEGREWRFEVHWRASQQDTSPPNYIAQLAGRSGVKELSWTPAVQEK